LLEYNRYKLDELDAIVFYDKPFLKFDADWRPTIHFARGHRFFSSAQYLYGLRKAVHKKEIYKGLEA